MTRSIHRLAPGLALITIALLTIAASAGEGEDLNTVVLEVRGMSSSMCELEVKNALAAIEGVEVLSIDRTQSEAIARIPTTVSAQHLADVVTKIGYAARLRSNSAAAARAESGLTAEELDLLAGSRCARYDACSIFGDLSGATGETLAMYVKEKAEDGRRFDDFHLPSFTAKNLAGEEVGLADLKGTQTVLVFLAVHCRHSLDSFPILNYLEETYGPQGIRVVGLYVNSGSIEDLNAWLPAVEPKFEIWGFNDPSLADLVESHLVPVYFFLDAEGRLLEKLVGQKSQDEVLARLGANFETTPAAAAR